MAINVITIINDIKVIIIVVVRMAMRMYIIIFIMFTN